MKSNLGIVICENFIEEIESALKNINGKNVIISTFTSECRCSNKGKNDSLIEAARKCEEKCSKIIIMCGTCCRSLKEFIVDKDKFKIHRFKYCFELLNNKDTISNFIIVDFFTTVIEKYVLEWRLEKNILERKRTENLRLKIQEQGKLLDEAMEYDKLKTEFFANLSHEFRTPINVMTSTLQLLNLIREKKHDSENEEKIKQYYHIMNQNCYRLLRLVNNLIDITKIDTGYFKINLRNENIITVIEDITLAVTGYAESKGLEVIFDTDIEEKIMACDPEKIERIILNLLSNAIKFTPFGGKILVSIEDKKSSIMISVKDNGVGIPYAMQKSIFEKFIQVDKSFSRNREGSGIGLSLVKSLVEMHGGTIGILSEYGNGSEFIIKLPARVLSEEQTTILEANIARASNEQRVNIEFSDIYD